MTVIKRSPYTFTMEQTAMRLTVSTKEFDAGYICWPTYTVDDKTYLQEVFELPIPKGCEVVKVTIPTFRGKHISNPIIIDGDTNVCWGDFTSTNTLLYPRIAVTQNRVYRLVVNNATIIDSEHGDIRFDWSYDINKLTPTAEDYVDDE